MRASGSVGILGLGRMGEPMAARLVAAGMPLTAWTRTPGAATHRLAGLGARIAARPAEVIEACDTVLVMLADLAAIDQVLGRNGRGFAVRLTGRTVVNTGTIAPSDSRELGADLVASGARYVEAPVSGSRVPAENGALVAMLAGPPEDLDRVEPVLGPLCSAVFRCGDVPGALTTKLAVNVFLIAMVTGLAEATHFARMHGVDPDTFRAVLDAGPMASDVSRAKLGMLLGGDDDPQASVRDVFYNSRLILDQARRTSTAVPVLAECAALFGAAEELGLGSSDMVAVIEAIRRSRPRGT